MSSFFLSIFIGLTGAMEEIEEWIPVDAGPPP